MAAGPAVLTIQMLQRPFLHGPLDDFALEINLALGKVK